MRRLARACAISLITLGATLALARTGAAQTPESMPRRTEGPRDIELGVWLADIHTIDLLDGSYGAELYMWWIAQDEDFRPFDVFQILNGRDWVARSVNRRVLSDGRWHCSAYLSVTASHRWDLHDYPFDRQTLQLVVETPFTADEVRLVPDVAGSVISEYATAEGFRFTDYRLREHVQRYPSDFGLGDVKGREYSRIVLEIELERASQRILVVTLVGFFVALLIAFLTYTVHVSLLNIRASMSAAAIFGAAGNMYSLQRAIHPSVGSLLIDRIALVTFGGIVVAILTGIVVDTVYRRDRLALARLINWSAFALVFVTTVVSIGLAVREASGS